MNKQPEALRLAGFLDYGFTISDGLAGEEAAELGEAADELRRLYEAEEHNRKYVTTLEDEVKRLHEANRAMFEAAEDAVDRIKSQLLLLKCDDEFISQETQKLRVAIAIAKGEQHE